MLTAHTSLTMCTQKMMWLNWCNFFRLRRPGRAPTPSWWGRSSWRHHNPLAETSILTHGCTSKSRPCHPSVQALPCGQRAPGPLHLHLHWHPQEHSSPCCFSLPPGEPTGLFTSRPSLPASPFMKLSWFGFALGSLFLGRGTRLGRTRGSMQEGSTKASDTKLCAKTMAVSLLQASYQFAEQLFKSSAFSFVQG